MKQERRKFRDIKIRNIYVSSEPVERPLTLRMRFFNVIVGIVFDLGKKCNAYH